MCDDMTDYLLRHTGHQDMQHVRHFHDTGELQMPLFDTADFSRTWENTDSWADEIKDFDKQRAAK